MKKKRFVKLFLYNTVYWLHGPIMDPKYNVVNGTALYCIDGPVHEILVLVVYDPPKLAQGDISSGARCLNFGMRLIYIPIWCM